MLAERLTRISLPGPAVRLTLAVERLAPFQALNASLLPPSRDRVRDGLDWLQLAETLHARQAPSAYSNCRWSTTTDPNMRTGSHRLPPIVAIHVPRSRCRSVAASPDEFCPRRNHCRSTMSIRAMAVRSHCLPARSGSSRLVDFGDPHRPTVHRDYFVARNRRGRHCGYTVS